MRLGIFSSAFFLSEETSGVSNNVFLIARELDRKYGVDIDVFSPYFFFTKNREESFGRSLKVHRYDHMPFFTGGVHYAPAAMNVFRKFRFDIVHSHHYGYVSSEAGFHNSRKLGVPHVLTTYYHPHQTNLLKKAMMGVYNRTVGRRIIEGSRFVTVQSNVEKDQISSIGKSDIRIIPCAIIVLLVMRVWPKSSFISASFKYFPYFDLNSSTVWSKNSCRFSISGSNSFGIPTNSLV